MLDAQNTHWIVSQGADAVEPVNGYFLKQPLENRVAALGVHRA
jgi:hypothetical protein